MPKLIILMGIPGSGKTTWAKKYIEDHPNENVYRVSSDEIREIVTGTDGDFSQENKVWKKYDDTIRKLSEQKDAIIIADSTHLSMFRRMLTLNSGINCEEREIIQFTTPYEKCVERRKYIDEHFMQSYEKRKEPVQREELEVITKYKEIET